MLTDEETEIQPQFLWDFVPILDPKFKVLCLRAPACFASPTTFAPRCHAPAVPAVQESPALARPAPGDIFSQATSSSRKCLPQPLGLFQTCSRLKAQLREAETGRSLP